MPFEAISTHSKTCLWLATEGNAGSPRRIFRQRCGQYGRVETNNNHSQPKEATSRANLNPRSLLRTPPLPNSPSLFSGLLEEQADLSGTRTNDSALLDVTYQWDALGRELDEDDGTPTLYFVAVRHQTIATTPSWHRAASP